MPVSELNTQYDEGAPFLTYDGSALYFSRMGVPGPYPGRLYSATRTAPETPFGTPQELTGLSVPGVIVDYSWVSPDNRRLYYYEGAWSVKMSQRLSLTDPWPMGVSVPELNALGGVANPSLTPDELTIVFTGTNVPGGLGGYDIWMGTRPDTSSPFGNFRNLTETNSTAWDFHPRLSSNGLELYFASERNGTRQIFEATRPSLSEPFGSPQHLSFFDLPGTWVEYPALSADGESLYFTRASSSTSYDIYVSHAYVSPTIPAPGALLLGGIGAGLIGCLRMRKIL